MLDPLEEEFHLPSAFVELGDGAGVEREIVAEENQPLASLRIIFCSVVMVSSNRRGGALRNPDQLRAPPRLPIRLGDQDTICQIKF
jgi:hypothetical protein